MIIFLFTDFGVKGPYLGQLKTVLYQGLCNVPVVDLMVDAPVHNPRAASYLLNAYASYLPEGCVVIAVVDPGVGSDQRSAVLVEADGRYFIGPGNGLFGVLQQSSSQFTVSRINYQNHLVSPSFHGRDVFAPFAVKLIESGFSRADLSCIDEPMPVLGPSDLAEVVYVDDFGNLITGLRSSAICLDTVLVVRNIKIVYARTFACVSIGEPFWYINSSGLVEIAVNRGRAKDYFKVNIGHSILVEK